MQGQAGVLLCFSFNMLPAKTSWSIVLHKPKPLSTLSNRYSVGITSPYS